MIRSPLSPASKDSSTCETLSRTIAVAGPYYATKRRRFDRSAGANSLAARRVAALFAKAALTENSTRRKIPCSAIPRVDAFIDVLRGDAIFLA